MVSLGQNAWCTVHSVALSASDVAHKGKLGRALPGQAYFCTPQNMTESSLVPVSPSLAAGTLSFLSAPDHPGILATEGKRHPVWYLEKSRLERWLWSRRGLCHGLWGVPRREHVPRGRRDQRNHPGLIGYTWDTACNSLK